MATTEFAAGGYRYIPAVFQYSGGVAAMPGYAIERVRFRKPVPLAEGFARIEAAHQPRRAAAHVLLRLRAALARPVHGRRAFAPSTRSTW